MVFYSADCNLEGLSEQWISGEQPSRVGGLGNLGFPLSDSKGLIALSQLAEMPPPNQQFRYALKGRQCGVDFIKLSTRACIKAVLYLPWHAIA